MLSGRYQKGNASFSNDSPSTAHQKVRLRPSQLEAGGGASSSPTLSRNVHASQPADFEHTDCSRPDIFAEMGHCKKCASPLTLHSVDKIGVWKPQHEKTLVLPFPSRRQTAED